MYQNPPTCTIPTLRRDESDNSHRHSPTHSVPLTDPLSFGILIAVDATLLTVRISLTLLD